MSRRRWILLGGVVVLIAIVVALRGTATGDSPEHSSASDAGNGTSALRLFAESLGHGTGTVEGEYSLPSSPALVFVFTVRFSERAVVGFLSRTPSPVTG